MEVEAKGREEVRPLREQWERMRKTVEDQVAIDGSVQIGPRNLVLIIRIIYQVTTRA
jgi:hypothetical protein